MTQTERIAHYEEILDRIVAASARLDAALDAFEAARPLVRELDDYCGGEDWRRDFADDEAGKLPAGLKRGVLSEDAAYDALTDDRQLLLRMREIAARELREDGDCRAAAGEEEYLAKENNGMKLAVIYGSKTGNTKQAAEWIAEGMNRVEGTEAKAFSIDAVDADFVGAAKGVAIGCPSYMASVTPDMRAWLMQGGKLGLAGKLGGAFATEQYTHGGGEMVLQSILTNELVFGMLCYSGGASLGKPVIHMGPVGVNGNVEAHNGMEHYRENFLVYGERFARKAAELFG